MSGGVLAEIDVEPKRLINSSSRERLKTSLADRVQPGSRAALVTVDARRPRGSCLAIHEHGGGWTGTCSQEGGQAHAGRLSANECEDREPLPAAPDGQQRAQP